MTAEKRQRSILRAAVPLFARQGFNGTTTKQIAEAAGVSEALLYKHFPGKDAIYSALEKIAFRKQEIASRVINMTPSTETLVRIVYLVIRSIYEGPPGRRIDGIDHDHMHRLMANSYLEDGAFARQFLERHVHTWEEAFLRCVEASIAAGDMIGAWIEPSARWWFSHHLAVAAGFLNLPEEQVIPYGFPREEIADQAVRFALRGMGLRDEAIAREYDLERLERFRRGLFGAVAHGPEPVEEPA